MEKEEQMLNRCKLAQEYLKNILDDKGFEIPANQNAE